MTITFNNVPKTIRTPGVYGEVDASRALTGLNAIPHVALIVGQKTSSGTAAYDTIMKISKDGLADGFFGPGSIAARMCNVFKENNPNTELHAIVIGSGVAGTAAGASVIFSEMLDGDTCSGTGTIYMMVAGQAFEYSYESGATPASLATGFKTLINSADRLPVFASITGASLYFSAKCSGTLGNYLNVRFNYYDGQTVPATFSGVGVVSAMYSHYVSFHGGATDPDLDDVWTVIDGARYNYIIQPYIAADNLTSLEGELADRFEPLEDLQGHGFTAVRGTQASCTTLGNSRNSPHNTIMGFYDAPNAPEEWAAALGGVAAYNLNQDPARPLHTLRLKGILPPPQENRFVRSERDILLYDGIATFIVDTGGNVLIERCITSYQKNALGIIDPTYLDVQTLATLGELRDQWKARMSSRFIVPRFKLADDGFPVTPGTNVATPNTIKQETVALFTELRNAGLIENLEEFIENLRVERDLTDRNRVNVLLPPDLINQFRILAGLFQFIL